MKEVLLIESDGNPEKKSRIRKALRYAAAAGAGAVASGLIVHNQGQKALKREVASHDSTKSALRYVDHAAKETSKENTELKGRVAQAETDRDAAEKGRKEALAANASLSQHLDAVKSEKSKPAQVASSEKPLALNAKPEVAVSKNLSNKRSQPDSKQTLFSRIATAVDSTLGSY